MLQAGSSKGSHPTESILCPLEMAEEAAAPEVLAEVPIADEANTKEDAPTTTDVEMKDEEKRGKPENKVRF